VPDAAFRVAQDFGACCFVVSKGIVGVVELIEEDALAIALHLLGKIAREFHAARHGRKQNSAPQASCFSAVRAADSPA
jgi:hypothetical protein